MHQARTILFLILASLTLAGCSSGVHECDDSGDCSSSQLCVHEHAHDIDADTCETPCTDKSQCPAGFSCGCPDSPTGEACRTDDDRAVFYCMPY